MNLKSLLFSFQGRINRLQYWVVTITLIVIGATSQMGNTYGPDNPMTVVPALLSLIGFVVVLWINLAVQVKRWHDLDKSVFWALINLVPVIGSIWVIITCGFFSGTAGNNHFGSKPILKKGKII